MARGKLRDRTQHVVRDRLVVRQDFHVPPRAVAHAISAAGQMKNDIGALQRGKRAAGLLQVGLADGDRLAVMRQVRPPPLGKIVDHDHTGAARQQFLDQERADQPASAGDSADCAGKFDRHSSSPSGRSTESAAGPSPTPRKTPAETSRVISGGKVVLRLGGVS